MTDAEKDRLLSIFKTETSGRLKEITGKMKELETASTPEVRKKILEVLYRESHSLKGAAQTIKWPDMELIGRAVSTAFYAVLRRSVPPPEEMLEAVRRVVALASTLLIAGIDASSDQGEVKKLTRQLQSIAASILGQNA